MASRVQRTGDIRWRALSPSRQLKRLSRDQTIYAQGEAARFWLEVECGIVRTCRYHQDGRRQLTGFFYPGDVFGIDRRTYLGSAEAVTDGAIVIRHAWPGGGDDDGAALPIIERALKSAESLIILLGHRTASARLAAFVLMMDRRLGTRHGLELPMTRYDIADFLGLTIATVSRTICDLARATFIALDTPQHLRILDRAGLQRVAGGEDLDVEDAVDDPLFAFDAPARQRPMLVDAE